MPPKAELNVLLWVSLGLGTFMLWRHWKPGARSVGLTLCYLASLGTIHFMGAWIATLAAYPVEKLSLVIIGFRECVVGIIAFVIGAFLAEITFSRPLISERTSTRLHSSMHRGELKPSALRANRPQAKGTGLTGLPYIIVGTACALCSAAFKSIPSLAAVVHCGAYLVIAGVCLEFLCAFRTNHRARALLWLSATASFPVLTMLTSGFIGYGVYAALMVFCFVLVHHRPRWQCGLAFCIICYLGLSVYVTYMRERQELRGAVWQGDAYSVRAGKLLQTFADFEFFEPNAEHQLDYIDERLNQNFLVGTAVVQLELGLQPPAHGRTILRALLGLIPRAVWPAKPVVAGSGDIVAEYTGIPFVEYTSVGVGQVMEFYINFGRCGVFLGFLAFGFAARTVDWHAATRLEETNVSGFVLWYLPGLGLLQPGGCLVEVFGTCAASWVIAYAANRVCNSGRSNWVGFDQVSERTAGPERWR